MNILVVNIGSTSFKFRLFDMADEHVIAQGAIEGIGRSEAQVALWCGAGTAEQGVARVADQAAAVAHCLAALQGWQLRIDAVGFKAVHGGDLPEVVPVSPEVLRVMETFADAAPAHNPAYVAAMRACAAQVPGVPLVAAFETGFHRTIPAARTTFAIPQEWTEAYGVRRYGFHGASHRYVAEYCARELGRADLRIVSCHLGGSSSVCALAAGQSMANSFALTPQSGLPQNNRVGDFDAYALLTLRARTGLDLDTLLARMAREGGLLGISGVSNDMREVLAAAAAGHARAALARDVFVESVRAYLGSYLVVLGGLDALVFTGGIGERSAEIRARVCAGLAFLGIELDLERNAQAQPDATLSRDGLAVRVLAIRTNEELIVARQTRAVLAAVAA
ncbi:MAG: acetate/propionate family kinase [Phycisphaerales bacterium]|nr:acetate/propionate family kinase [Phycisphaerales bacterium]